MKHAANLQIFKNKHSVGCTSNHAQLVQMFGRELSRGGDSTGVFVKYVRGDVQGNVWGMYGELSARWRIIQGNVHMEFCELGLPTWLTCNADRQLLTSYTASSAS